MAYEVDTLFTLVSDDNDRRSHLVNPLMGFWDRKVLYI